MAFIDALKPEYEAYLDALVDGRLAPGALVVADNVLWSGRVSGSRPGDDPTTRTRTRSAGSASGSSATTGSRATILPVGDGLLIATWHG